MKDRFIKKIPLPLGHERSECKRDSAQPVSEGWVRVEGLPPTYSRIRPSPGSLHSPASPSGRGTWYSPLCSPSLAARCVLGRTTSLSITVVDPQHAAIPKARVAVYSQGASTAIRGTTNEQGIYAASLSSFGTFLVEVDADGFNKTVKTVFAGVGQSVDEVIPLEIAGIDSSVVVTASDMPQTFDQTSKAITVVTSEEIHNRDEYTLAGVLSAIPGVQIHNVGGPGQSTSLRVRGLRSDSSAILIDGMRFRDAATAQGDAGPFLGQLNIISPDRVEVLRGSGSSLYGTNAASGVVNIITDPGGGVTHGTIQAEGGNLGFARGRMQISGGTLNDRLKYSAGLLHLNVMRGVDGNDRTRSTGGQASLTYDLTLTNDAIRPLLRLRRFRSTQYLADRSRHSCGEHSSLPGSFPLLRVSHTFRIATILTAAVHPAFKRRP